MEVVLVDCEDKTSNNVVSKSGFKFSNTHIITVGSLITPFLQQKQMNIQFFVTRNSNGNLFRQEAVILRTFKSEIANTCVHELFGEWSIDSSENSNFAKQSLCLFVILSLDFDTKSDVRDALAGLRRVVGGFKKQIFKGREVFVESVPFGNKYFINNHSCGIVSNVVGRNNCFVLSDCPTVPGSEGSPMYFKGNQNSKIPIGIILSSLSWWRGEWIGLTLCINLFALLDEICTPQTNFKGQAVDTTSPSLEEKFLMQVTCGGQWGTGILLSKDDGILLTNSHVVSKKHRIELRFGDRRFSGEILYQTPDDSPCDFAICKTDPKNCESMKSVTFAKKAAVQGEIVYALGYSLFPQKTQAGPMVSRGVIAHVSQTMLRTTCCINPGASGGALLRPNGELLGIIVSNAKLMDKERVTFPRVNMSIPISAVIATIERFLEFKDVDVLRKELECLDPNLWKSWTVLYSKL